MSVMQPLTSLTICFKNSILTPILNSHQTPPHSLNKLQAGNQSGTSESRVKMAHMQVISYEGGYINGIYDITNIN